MADTKGTYSRRDFIRIAGGTLFGVSLVGLAGCEFNSVDPIAAGRDIPFLTPVDEFFVKNGAEISISNWTMPVIPRESWQLRIDGLASSPVTIGYGDLEAESGSAINLLKTIRCVIDSNDVQGLIGTAVWRGIPLKLFLDRAGIDMSRTKRLRLYGSDGFTNNIPIERIYGLQPSDLVEPLLVTHMNDNPLTPAHGAPVRLIIHESFGYKNVKWIERIEATDSDAPFGTYQDAEFADDGVIRPISRATEPLDNSQVPAGPVTVRGFAVSGEAPVESVMISVNGGAYVETALEDATATLSADPLIADAVQFTDTERFIYPFRAVWRKWSYTFDALPGPNIIRIRATDAAGNMQPETDTDISDGINAILSLRFTAG